MAKTVVGLMDSWSEAQEVARDLVGTGIDHNRIGIMASERHASATQGGEQERFAGEAGKGALAGAGTGAAIGGIAGLALAFAPITLPGIGAIVAAGPIAAALTGAGVGAVAGGLIGGLTKVGVPEEHAHYYAEGVRRGGTLVTVHAESEAQADQAVQVLHKHGAVDVEERGQSWRSEGWSGRYDERSPAAELGIPSAVPGARAEPRPSTPGAVRVYQGALGDSPVAMPGAAANDEPVKPKRKRATSKKGGSLLGGYTGPERRTGNGSTTWEGIERRRSA